MNKITSSLLAAFGLLTIAVSEAAASLASDILAAVDAPSTITYLGSTYVKYKLVKDDDGAYSIATDDNWDPIIDKRTTECKWEIQKKEVVNTFPKQGSSCLHSTIGTGKLENDAQYAALTFQVTGPGIFSFWYKTSTFSAKTSDYLTVIVDGKDMNFTAEGYDEYGDGSVTWEQCSIEIPGGTYDQDDGTRQYSHSSPYEHEVTFIFYKDEPAYDYDWDKDKYTYVEDGPEGIGWEKDKDLGEDPYWGPKSVYETAKANFGNCVWLDGFSWTPNTPTLFIANEEETVNDFTYLDIVSDADDFGYLVKYALDGSTPSKNSPTYDPDVDDESIEGILIDASCTVKAQIFVDDSTPLSPAVTAAATFTVKATSPSLTKTTVDSAVVLTATASYARNTIHYTLDGSTPTEASPVWTQNLTVDSPTILKAICIRKGVLDSGISSLEVTRCQPPVVDFGDTTFYAEERLTVFEGDSCAFTATAAAEETLTATLNGSPVDASQPIKASDGNVVSYRAEQAGSLPSDAIAFTAKEANLVVDIEGQLQPGWNLVGLPCALLADEARELLNAYNVFRLDSATCTYTKATHLNPGEACWIFCSKKDNDTEFAVVGASFSASAGQGWSLSSPDSYPAKADVWKYQDGAFQAVTSKSFQPGKGYLIHRK